jgi:hypothetical protein
VAKSFKTVIDEMTQYTNFSLVNLSLAENANLTHEDLNTSIDKSANQWNIHLVWYDTLTSQAKPSSNGQLSHSCWSFGMFAESNGYKTKKRVGWRIVMNARNVSKLQVTVTPGFDSLYDRCYQAMWLY